ncbi:MULTISPECIES: type 1 glutamine amidotransferase [unclassified Paraflavitalea]|uniref:type 1 glutamine amidotransferase n=1 Tax=unclassified Paraflavitalea TaxID=2798305 RepID=UPI003D331B94
MKQLRIICIQHVSFEGPGTIALWAQINGHSFQTMLASTIKEWPSLHSFDWLIVMGGPMAVYEEEQLPWMKAEKAFIRAAIDAEKILLGICLGSQLIASALGAKVYPHHTKEIGWFSVNINSEEINNPFAHFTYQVPFFHWHGDTFDLPTNAKLLASTEQCKHQAFSMGSSILGIQFHPEVDSALVAAMVAHGLDELKEDKFVQSSHQILAFADSYATIRQEFFILLDEFSKQ